VTGSSGQHIIDLGWSSRHGRQIFLVFYWFWMQDFQSPFYVETPNRHRLVFEWALSFSSPSTPICSNRVGELRRRVQVGHFTPRCGRCLPSTPGAGNRVPGEARGLAFRQRCWGRSAALGGGFVGQEGGERVAHFGWGKSVVNADARARVVLWRIAFAMF